MAIKIWAYATDEAGQYIRYADGNLRFFFIWQALRLKNTNIFEHKKRTYWSTQQDESKRSEMVPVKNGFFRYKGQSGENAGSGDGESLSHQIAIFVLSELKTINFVFGNKECELNFQDLRFEDTKIRFESGRFYYPDLIGFFSKGDPFYEKWGGKVAIEVKVSHGCEKEKLQDFMDHNIPIIEVNITESLRFREELKGLPFDEDDLERYSNYLKSKFSNKVFAKVLVNPSSASYVKRVFDSEKRKHETLAKAFEAEKDKSLSLTNELVKANQDIYTLSDTSQEQKGMIDEYRKAINDFKNRSFFQRLIALFKAGY